MKVIRKEVVGNEMVEKMRQTHGNRGRKRKVTEDKPAAETTMKVQRELVRPFVAK